jgi:hypothetical protein
MSVLSFLGLHATIDKLNTDILSSKRSILENHLEQSDQIESYYQLSIKIKSYENKCESQAKEITKLKKTIADYQQSRFMTNLYSYSPATPSFAKGTIHQKHEVQSFRDCLLLLLFFYFLL